MARVRSRTILASRGRTFRFGSWSVDDNAFQRLNESCSDETAKGDCLQLTVSRWGSSGGILNNTAGLKGVLFENWVASDLNSSGFFGGYTFTDAPTNTAAATQVAARTSPSRPVVDVPANIFELADISRLLKLTMSNSLLKTVANNNLRYWFGIVPLVGDLAKLTEFTKHVDRRVKVIKKLASAKGYRRTVDVYSGTQTGSQSVRINSTNEAINTPCTYAYHLDMRAHARWFASPDKSIYNLENDAQLRMLAQRAVLGLANPLSVDFLTSAWEAFPWSWLIDWCGNVGDYMTAHRNIIPATLGQCCVMRHSRTDVNFTSGNNPLSGTSWSGGNWYSEIKSRVPANPSLTAHFPFLSGKQMGILASLAIMRT